MKMLKGILSLATVAFMLAAALAETIDNAEYTNVPGTSTQDAVTDCTAGIRLDGDEIMEWSVEILQPNEVTMGVLSDIYNYVMENDVMPARYFTEEVQLEIREILDGGDPEILHMTEFMSVQPETADVEDGVANVKITFDVDYQPGQLVVVMFGDLDDVDVSLLTQDEIRETDWTPLEAEVTETGVIEFEIPHTLLMDIQGEHTLFSVLTDRVGGRGSGTSGETETPQESSVPSKDATDMTTISETYYTYEGEAVPDDFRIFITPRTPLMQEEIRRIRDFIVQSEEEPDDDLPVCRWFEEETLDEIALLLEKDFDLETLVAYEIKAVAAENYVDTYGDVRAVFQFATPYYDGQNIVAVLGLPKTETPEDGSTMEWTVLRTVVEDNLTKIDFKQLLLHEMEEQELLLIVLSEPFETEDE